MEFGGSDTSLEDEISISIEFKIGNEIVKVQDYQIEENSLHNTIGVRHLANCVKQQGLPIYTYGLWEQRPWCKMANGEYKKSLGHLATKFESDTTTIIDHIYIVEGRSRPTIGWRTLISLKREKSEKEIRAISQLKKFQEFCGSMGTRISQSKNRVRRTISTLLYQ